MSFIISDESGTCAALPLRDSWGTHLTVDHWTAQVQPQARPFPPLHRAWQEAHPSVSPLPASQRAA